MINQEEIARAVSVALAEDVGSGDITAKLIPEAKVLSARVISREQAIVCGRAFVDETFRQVDPSIQLAWEIKEGGCVQPNQILFHVAGKARSLLTAERTALNFLQMLSGTATLTHHYASLIAHTSCRLLDTRKTIPGFRLAQKYAVGCGGGHNHRMGLYDAFLIKENHIAACGGIAQAIEAAKKLAPGKSVEIEVENLDEFDLAQGSGANIIMLDNMSLEEMKIAVGRRLPHVKIEASGNVSLDNIVDIALTGVDFISVGGITKNIQAIDLSMRYI